MRTESIAGVTERVLYNVSTSELGTAANTAESGLLSVFRRAERWKAVVLLDEADLFLTKRTVDHLDRNALVTVFLRTLEYFKGVMFLTSNRVEHFDPAFESRIHVRVHFGSPNAATRAQIWQTLLPGDGNEGMAEKLGNDIEVNGRQIKNLVRVAVLMSKYKKEPITEAMLRKIYATSAEAQERVGSTEQTE